MTACRHRCPRHFEKNENRKEKSGNLFRESVICQSLKTVEYGSRGKAGGQTAGSDVPEPCRTVIGFGKAGSEENEVSTAQFGKKSQTGFLPNCAVLT